MKNPAQILPILALALPALVSPTWAMSASDVPNVIDDTRAVTLDLTGMT